MSRDLDDYAVGEPIHQDRHEFVDDTSAYEMSAIRDPECPGGVFSHFHYWDTADGRRLLRSDNAHDDPDLGAHHRHGEEANPNDPDREIDFEDIWTHIDRFLQEVSTKHDERTR